MADIINHRHLLIIIILFKILIYDIQFFKPFGLDEKKKRLKYLHVNVKLNLIFNDKNTFKFLNIFK